VFLIGQFKYGSASFTIQAVLRYNSLPPTDWIIAKIASVEFTAAIAARVGGAVKV